MRKIAVFIVLISVVFVFYIAAEDTSGDTLTSESFEGVKVINANQTPIPLYNAIGIEIGMISKVIPGISYTRVLNKDIACSVFAGAIYDPDGVMGLVQANAYYLFNEFIYAGLGISWAMDEDSSMIFGFANPTLGLTSSITDNIKFYIETTVLLFAYSTKQDLESSIGINNPVPILKLGLKYYY